jgi:hypothetical protein
MEGTKKKSGRPRGLSPILTLTVSAATLARIDAVAADFFESRRAAARRLLDAGLAVEAHRSPLARSRGRA